MRFAVLSVFLFLSGVVFAQAEADTSTSIPAESAPSPDATVVQSTGPVGVLVENRPGQVVDVLPLPLPSAKSSASLLAFLGVAVVVIRALMKFLRSANANFIWDRIPAWSKTLIFLAAGALLALGDAMINGAGWLQAGLAAIFALAAGSTDSDLKNTQATVPAAPPSAS